MCQDEGILMINIDWKKKITSRTISQLVFFFFVTCVTHKVCSIYKNHIACALLYSSIRRFIFARLYMYTLHTRSGVVLTVFPLAYRRGKTGIYDRKAHDRFAWSFVCLLFCILTWVYLFVQMVLIVLYVCTMVILALI